MNTYRTVICPNLLNSLILRVFTTCSFPSFSRSPRAHEVEFPPNRVGCSVHIAIHTWLSRRDRRPIIGEHPRGSEARIQRQLRCEDSLSKMRHSSSPTKTEPRGNSLEVFPVSHRQPRYLSLSGMRTEHSETTAPFQRYRPKPDASPGVRPVNEQALLQNQ